MSAANLLTKFRGLLAKHSLQAYIIPTADAHQSEYVSSSDMRRAFISGFDGSAGTAVVTTDKALLWTDGRYFLQASNQLDSSSWELMKFGLDGVPNLDAWLSTNLPSGSTVGCDPFLLSVSQFKAYENTLANKNVKLVGVDGNLVDQVWEGKPALPNGVIKVHPVQVAGETVESKLAKLRAQMVTSKAHAMVVCALDEIAWLFNLRGSDIQFNPVFLSYALITPTDATLYVDESKFAADVLGSLSGVTIKPYTAVTSDLAALKDTLVANKAAGAAYKLWIDAGKSNVAVYSAVGLGIGKSQNPADADLLIETANPIALLKAVKNDVEIEGMKQAHIRDAVAMVKFLSWFETQYGSLPAATASEDAIKNSPWNEYTISEKLESFRALGDKFVGLSFDTISSIGANGAIIHYKPDETTSANVTTGKVYLLDSGAQYLDGTTDITRTFWIPGPGQDSTPSDFQKEAYTRVLQGHIALADTPFPTNTMGPALDVLARMYLWQVGLNFMHGTGHGVGSYLNVHEGPHGIAMMNRGGTITTTALVPGMVVSNEPGYYHDGEFGIRIENLVYVTKKATKHSQDYLGLENLTLVPLDRALIDMSLLSPAHVQYFDNYHKQIRAVVGPLVQQDEVAYKWLIKNTEPLA